MPHAIAVHPVFAKNGDDFTRSSALAPHDGLLFNRPALLLDTAQCVSYRLEFPTLFVSRQVVTPHFFTTRRHFVKERQVVRLRFGGVFAQRSHRSRNPFLLQPKDSFFVRHILFVLSRHLILFTIPSVDHLFCPTTFCVCWVEVRACSSQVTGDVERSFVEARCDILFCLIRT